MKEISQDLKRIYQRLDGIDKRLDVMESRLGEKVEASPLTPREVEVLELLAQSLTNDQVARRLGISVDTVKRHVSAILAKLGVQDRLGAVMWGIKNRIIILGG